MSRYGHQQSYGHHCQYVGWDAWSISWTVDRYMKNSRLRWPNTYTRVTDSEGAKQFCKKWGIEFPDKGKKPVRIL